MVTLAEIQSLAFDLPKADQLKLADSLLVHAGDEEVAMEPEAIRREEEITSGQVHS